MAPRFKTAVAQLCVVDGEWQERTDQLRVVEPRALLSLGKGRDALYLLLEPMGSFPDPDDVCRRLADLIEQAYWPGRGSITARLRYAIQEANRTLFEENLQAKVEERGIVGISCAVLHNDSLFLAQAGPSLVYLAHGDELRRFPADSPWLSRRAPNAINARQATAVGWRREIEPDLFHAQVAKSDLIVLASTSLVRLADEAEIVGALVQTDSESAISALEALAEGATLAAIAIEIEPGTTRVRQAATAATRGRASARAAQAATAQAERAEAAEAEIYRPAAPRRPRASEYAAGRSAAGAAPAPARSLLQRIGAIGQGLLPERQTAAKGGATPGQGALPTALRIGLIALIIPALIAIVYFWNSARLERERQAQIAAKLATAGQLVAAAQAGTPPEQRSALYQADALLVQLLTESPQHQEASALRQQIAARLDEVNKVSRVNFVGELTRITGTDSIRPSRLAMGQSEIYVLDTGIGRVAKYTLDETRQSLKSEIPEILLDASTVVDGNKRTPLDITCLRMALRPEDGNLVILAQGGTILERGGQPLRLVARALENGAALRAPQAVETYYDAPNLYLYVLDPAENVIKKFQATADGSYTDAPEDYRLTDPTITLRDGVDLAIDGSIYVLLKNGEIVKLFQGKEVDFPQEGLDQPLSNPVAIAISRPDDMSKGSVYVADAGNQRIVEFDKAGHFSRQFRPAADKLPFDDLRDIAVDGATPRLFLLNGTMLGFINLSD